MTEFDISFVFNEKIYKASILKEAGPPVNYLASINKPHDLDIDYPVRFIAQRKTEMLGWIPLHDYPQLAGLIASASTDYCRQQGVDLFRS